MGLKQLLLVNLIVEICIVFRCLYSSQGVRSLSLLNVHSHQASFSWLQDCRPRQLMVLKRKPLELLIISTNCIVLEYSDHCRLLDVQQHQALRSC